MSDAIFLAKGEICKRSEEFGCTTETVSPTALVSVFAISFTTGLTGSDNSDFTSVLAEDSKTESNTSPAVTTENKSDIPLIREEPVSEEKDHHAEEDITVPPVEVDKPKAKSSVLKPSSKKMSFKLTAIEDEKEIEERKK